MLITAFVVSLCKSIIICHVKRTESVSPYRTSVRKLKYDLVKSLKVKYWLLLSHWGTIYVLQSCLWDIVFGDAGTSLQLFNFSSLRIWALFFNLSHSFSILQLFILSLYYLRACCPFSWSPSPSCFRVFQA